MVPPTREFVIAPGTEKAYVALFGPSRKLIIVKMEIKEFQTSGMVLSIGTEEGGACVGFTAKIVTNITVRSMKADFNLSMLTVLTLSLTSILRYNSLNDFPSIFAWMFERLPDLGK